MVGILQVRANGRTLVEATTASIGPGSGSAPRRRPDGCAPTLLVVPALSGLDPLCRDARRHPARDRLLPQPAARRRAHVADLRPAVAPRGPREDGTMRFDLMTGAATWADAAQLARDVEGAGLLAGCCSPRRPRPRGWRSRRRPPRRRRSSSAPGIAVAFPRSPMVAAGLAWELAENTGGRFRLGLGSQVKAHVERRYGAEFDPPGPRMRDYLAGRAGVPARLPRRGAPRPRRCLTTSCPCCPPEWAPRRHDFGDIKVDVSAVGPWMCRMAGEVADGIHVHPLHSHAVPRTNGCCPAVAEGAAKAGRSPSDVDLIIPVFAIPGDTPEERAALVERARFQIAFYGSTRNYAFQFDDLGFEGTSARLNERLKAGDLAGMAATDHRRDARALRRRSPRGTISPTCCSRATAAWRPGSSCTSPSNRSGRIPRRCPDGARWPRPSPQGPHSETRDGAATRRRCRPLRGSTRRWPTPRPARGRAGPRRSHRPRPAAGGVPVAAEVARPSRGSARRAGGPQDRRAPPTRAGDRGGRRGRRDRRRRRQRSRARDHPDDAR